DDLWIEHGAAWRAALPPLPGSCYWGPFVRGFVEGVTAYHARDFLPRVREVFTAAPVRRLCLMRMDADEAEKLARLRELSRLAALEVRGGKLGPAGARHLALCPHLANLTTLDLAGADVEDGGAQALARSPHLSRLTRLGLHSNALDAEGVLAVV